MPAVPAATERRLHLLSPARARARHRHGPRPPATMTPRAAAANVVGFRRRLQGGEREPLGLGTLRVRGPQQRRGHRLSAPAPLGIEARLREDVGEPPGALAGMAEPPQERRQRDQRLQDVVVAPAREHPRQAGTEVRQLALQPLAPHRLLGAADAGAAGARELTDVGGVGCRGGLGLTARLEPLGGVLADGRAPSCSRAAPGRARAAWTRRRPRRAPLRRRTPTDERTRAARVRTAPRGVIERLAQRLGGGSRPTVERPCRVRRARRAPCDW